MVENSKLYVKNPKKILYVTEEDLTNPQGVGIFKKIYYQCKVFQDFGYSVRIYCLNYSNPRVTTAQEIAQQLNRKTWKSSRTPFLLKIIYLFYYWINLIKILKTSNFRAIYIRLPIPNPLAILALQTFKGVRIIEVPTSPFANEIKNLNFLKKFLLKAAQKFFLKPMLDSADLVVQMGDKDVKNITQTRVIKIANGISVEEIKPKEKFYLPDKVINLIGVANVSFWHGFDRVILGLANYYQKKPNVKVYFHIVGEGEELKNLKDLTKKLGLEDYVVFHGVKTGRDLDEIYDLAHVGVGRLGLHRINITNAAGLKEREYCAIGLPFIIAHEDEDFPDNVPFVLKVSPDDSPISIEEIIEFVKSLYENYPVISRKMRLYANNRLSWHSKIKELLNFLN